jgi:hypothetical protein
MRALRPIATRRSRPYSYRTPQARVKAPSALGVGFLWSIRRRKSSVGCGAGFKQRLVTNPTEVLAEHGYDLPPGVDVRLQVVASDENVQYLYLPCEGELSENTSAQAGGVASECVNNRLALAQLAAGSRSAGTR